MGRGRACIAVVRACVSFVCALGREGDGCFCFEDRLGCNMERGGREEKEMEIERTHALRTRKSTSDRYASYRTSSGSCIGLPSPVLAPLLLCAVAHFCSLPDGTGCGSFFAPVPASDPSAYPLLVVVAAGMRNGSAPLGEAWLFEAWSSKSMARNLRYVYTVQTHQLTSLLQWGGRRGRVTIRIIAGGGESVPATSSNWD